LHASLRQVDGASERQAERLQRGLDWLGETRAAFLESYDHAAQAAGLASAAAQRRSLLELFLFEKVMYELKYEMENRPDWVVIPLSGLLDLFRAKA
jgi:maltose alpha-D-glucosyltransferase/alpha-amylase